jgi:hypothetical protein
MSDFNYTVWYDVPEPGVRGSGQGFRDFGPAQAFACTKRDEGFAHTWIEDHEAERAKLECLQHGPNCQGKVDMHSLDGLKAFPRCEYHWEQRLDEQARIDETYGSPSPPDWFDPFAAGERWDEDDY